MLFAFRAGVDVVERAAQGFREAHGIGKQWVGLAAEDAGKPALLKPVLMAEQFHRPIFGKDKGAQVLPRLFPHGFHSRTNCTRWARENSCDLATWRCMLAGREG